MAVTRLERKARRNKTRAKERTLAIKRNIRRNFVASPYKEESGIILEDDVLTVAQNLSTGAKPKAKKAEKKVEEAPEATAEVAETPAPEAEASADEAPEATQEA